MRQTAKRDDRSKLIQARISKHAGRLIAGKVRTGMLGSEANYLRALVYRDLGLVPDKAEE